MTSSVRVSLLTLLFVATAILFASKTFASEDFSTNYDVTYEINKEGAAHVTQHITVTNLESGTYAKEYTLHIASLRLENIRAFTPTGQLELAIKTEADKTAIRIPFSQKVIGKGKRIEWTLTYDTEDIASVERDVLSVTIPRISVSGGMNEYQVLLKVPKTFADPSVVSPKPKEKRQEYATNVYVFQKDDIAKQGVHAIFGSEQTYGFTISYHLANSGLVAVQKKITLPPTTPYQTVVIDAITPKPVNVYTDEDKNWIAVFEVGRNQKIDVAVFGKVKLTPTPGFKETLSDVERQWYLEPKQYWESDNQKISRLIAVLSGKENGESERTKESDQPQLSANEAARKIFDYVAATLQFSQTQNQSRPGALKILDDPKQATSLAFADLFVALSRAANIPARVVIGYVNNGNSALKPKDDAAQNNQQLHTWAQYWREDQGWISVDPTWSQTTGGVDYFDNWDMHHVALAFWGKNSDTPEPPGLFREYQNQKDIHFSVVDSFETPKPDVFVSTKILANSGAGFPGRGEIYIQNKGKSAVNGMNLEISSDGFSFIGERKYTVAMLPPYGVAKYPFTFRSSTFFRLTRSVIRVKVNDVVYTIPVSVSPFAGRAKELVLVPVGSGLLIGILVTVLCRKRLKRLPKTKNTSIFAKLRILFTGKKKHAQLPAKNI